MVRTPNGSSPRRRLLSVVLGLLVFVVAACGSDSGSSDTDEEGAPTATTTPSTTQAPTPERTIDDTFAVGADGHQLAMQCYGEGSPAIILEAGTDSSGADVFPTSFITPLAQEHMTCVYDRQGTGRSDEPTAPMRTLDDLAADLQGLLDTAGIPAPYLLVGSSGGGMVDVQFATNHPESVAGLALLDVGVPNPNLAEEYPDEANANNPEHVHWFNAERDLSMLSMPIGDFPVLVVAAEGGDMPDQSFWLDLSPDAEQVVMPGGHDLYQEYPEEVAAQILTSLETS